MIIKKYNLTIFIIYNQQIMITKEETNYLLAIFSTIGLTYFLYTPSSWSYIIMIPFLIFKNTL